MSTKSIAVVVAGAAQEAVAEHVPALVEAKIASRIAAHDATLWGPDAESEASIRLGWTDLATESRALLPEIESLAAQVRDRGINRIVLAGMGGSSLAPEVITGTYGVPLVTLDSTDPQQVKAALDGDLSSTLLVVSSKSGGTVETDSQRRAFESAFSAAGLDPREHIVVVTDPGSPLETSATEAGYKVFLSNPNVGGRFSALTAFGLVPSALAGVPVAELLDQAEAAVGVLTADSADNPGLILGAALAGTSPLRDKAVIVDEGSGIAGLGDWIEQLVAESTGKEGHGILPVIVPSAAAPELASPAADVLPVRLVAEVSEAGEATEAQVAGSLGAQLLLWEYATSVAGYLLGINPFDQPDVESAKVAARSLLDSTPEPEPALFTDGDIEVRATDGLLEDESTVADAVSALLAQLDADNGYIAVLAYLDRIAYPQLATVRDALAARSGRPVTFGWGPRFLHSTGQLHKGGPAVGVYLQITATSSDDLEIPGRPFSFGTLISAQASGDAGVLADRGRPVLRLNLAGGQSEAAIAQLIEVLSAPSQEPSQ